MRAPWNDWYHVMGHTYGTWLPGNPKGFRTRHHREHIIGDYKNPPPKGMYEERFRRAKQLMKRDPVYLDPEQRQRAVEEVVRSLTKRGIPLVVLSIDRIHLHLLGQFRDHNPRRWVGIAKKESSHYLKVSGHGPEGGLWATRCKCLPIRGTGHYAKTYGYVLDHEEKGGCIWEYGPMDEFDPDCLLID